MNDLREQIFQALMKAMDAHQQALDRRDTPANVAFLMGRCSGLSEALQVFNEQGMDVGRPHEAHGGPEKRP
jgi:hypothetical protein